MALTPEQLAAREGKLTASGIAALMTGDEAKIYNLWRMLICDPSWSPEDLSDVWPVQLGSATEKLHLDWIARKHGQISRRGEVVVSKSIDWAACTLDGWADQHKCPVEAKHVGGFETRETIVQRYYPQMTWQMVVTGAPKCMLSIIEGAREPVQEFINYDSAYADELTLRARAFMKHGHDLTPPVEIEPVREPMTPFKTYDYSENNVFVSAAVDWLETKKHADWHKEADRTLKEIIPADAVKVTGGGLVVKRDRANRLRVTKEK